MKKKISEIELPQEVLDDIVKQGSETIKKFIDEETELKDIEKDEEERELLIEIYRNLKDILKKYCDIEEEYYPVISLWIIGTYFHNEFPTYPFLFFNAMKGAGKSRMLKLIAYLSNEGVVLNSLREAELFRSKGTLAIDEFESIQRKGLENLRELLNSAYKKGTKVRRMRKVSTKEGEKQEVEEFDVYRPIVMANISGMEEVLDDRCIKVTLEKSENKRIINLMEIFENDEIIGKTRELLKKLCIVCNVELHFNNYYTLWNSYVYSNYIYTYIHNIHTIHTIHHNIKSLFEKLRDSNINGRELEISFPLILLSMKVDDIDNVISTMIKIMKQRKEEHYTENWDISLYDFLSQEVEDDYYHPISELTRKFGEFLNYSGQDLHTQWMGLALKRLNLILYKKRKTKGIEVRINYKKAQEKIKIFK